MLEGFLPRVVRAPIRIPDDGTRSGCETVSTCGAGVRKAPFSTCEALLFMCHHSPDPQATQSSAAILHDIPSPAMVHAVVSLFCKREDISFETFKEILEGEFVPLLEKLTGPLFPMTYTRRYMAHEDNARERSRAGPLGMPSLIVGSAETVTWVGCLKPSL